MNVSPGTPALFDCTSRGRSISAWAVTPLELLKTTFLSLFSVLVVGSLSSFGATPLSSLDQESWQTARLRQQVGASAKTVTAPVIEEAAPETDPNWRFGVLYFQGTANSLGDIFTGSYDILAQNGIRLTAARYLTHDLWNLPIDVLLECGLMYHDEKGKQSDTFQYTLGFKFEWTRFPWHDHLRTRFGFTTGLSYADQIPWAEKVNRGTDSSKHLLHYLDFTLAFNCADISRLTRLEVLFPGNNADTIDHVWLTVGIPHRSGAYGLYGSDRTGEDIQGGSNYLSIGLEADF